MDTMNNYLEQLADYSASLFGDEYQGRANERELIDFHASLDLPNAITYQIRPVLEGTAYVRENNPDRIWATVVIELYIQLLDHIGVNERVAARAYVDDAQGADRLARMCMLIWLHPVHAPQMAWSLAETPATWLGLDEYWEARDLRVEIARRLGAFATALEHIHLLLKDQIIALQERCFDDYASIGEERKDV